MYYNWQTTSSNVISNEYQKDIENIYTIESVVEGTHGLHTLYEPTRFILSGDVFDSGTGSNFRPDDFVDMLRYARGLAGDLSTLLLILYGVAEGIALTVVNQLTTIVSVLEIGIVISLIAVSSVISIVGRRFHHKTKRDKKKKENRPSRA